MNIDRNQIIELIKKSLHDLDFVNALWLEGADSQGLVDDYSDIDMWIDVNEGKQDGVLQIIRNELSKLGEIDFDFEKNHPHPQIRQMFLHIKGSSKYLILDLCIQSNDRVFWYTNGMDGEKVKIIFDNKKVIRFKPMNTKEYNAELSSRKNYLLKKYQIMKVDTQKEIERNDYLGALNFYISLAEIFTELIRIKSTPTKHEFGLKHASRDLPNEQKMLIERIYQYKTIADIKNNIELMDAYDFEK